MFPVLQPQRLCHNYCLLHRIRTVFNPKQNLHGMLHVRTTSFPSRVVLEMMLVVGLNYVVDWPRFVKFLKSTMKYGQHSEKFKNAIKLVSSMKTHGFIQSSCRLILQFPSPDDLSDYRYIKELLQNRNLHVDNDVGWLLRHVTLKWDEPKNQLDKELQPLPFLGETSESSTNMYNSVRSQLSSLWSCSQHTDKN